MVLYIVIGRSLATNWCPFKKSATLSTTYLHRITCNMMELGVKSMMWKFALNTAKVHGM